MIEMALKPLIKDVDRLLEMFHKDRTGLLLIGRRYLRSNNSWMHNLNVLVKGKNRCTLYLHPLDAEKKNIRTGDMIKINSSVGSLVVKAELNEDITPGVVSLPHGWEHHYPDTLLEIAQAKSGVDSNVLTDEKIVDAVSENAVLNGIPITIKKLSHQKGEDFEWQFTH